MYLLSIKKTRSGKLCTKKVHSCMGGTAYPFVPWKTLVQSRTSPCLLAMAQPDMRSSSTSHPQAVPLAPWQHQPRPEYLPFDQPQYPAGRDPHFEALRLEQMHLSPELSAIPASQPFGSPAGSNGFVGTANQPGHFYQPLPISSMHDFALHPDMAMQPQYDAAQPPASMENVMYLCFTSPLLPFAS